MSDSNLVRVRVGDQETNLSRAWAEKKGLEILDESAYRGDGSVRRPTRAGGRPMKPRITLPPAGTGDPDGPADDEVPYSKRSVKELEALIEARNDSRGDDEPQIEVAAPGNKPDLINALEADDQAAAALQAAADAAAGE